MHNDPGSDPSSDPGSNPGSDPSSDPGSDPTSDPGSIITLSQKYFIWLKCFKAKRVTIKKILAIKNVKIPTKNLDDLTHLSSAVGEKIIVD